MIRRSLAAAVICLLAAGTAHATLVSGSFSGIIAGNTHDSYGLFGTPGGDFSGQTLTASYSYDTALMTSYTAQAGSDSWLGTGALALSVTIGGTTVATAGVTESEVIDTAAGPDTMVTLANLAPTPLLDFALLVTGAWVPGVTIDTPFVLDPTDYQQTIYLSADGSHYDTLNFVGESVAVIPEPAAWTWCGLALAALARLRRHRTISA